MVGPNLTKNKKEIAAKSILANVCSMLIKTKAFLVVLQFPFRLGYRERFSPSSIDNLYNFLTHEFAIHFTMITRKWLNGKLAWKIGKSRQANDVEKEILCTQEAIINKLRSFSYVLAAYVKLSMVFNLI